jgi:isoprene synthase
LEGENLLEEAKALTRGNLEDLNSRNLVKQANHALQLPLHRSTDRLTAEWSIEAIMFLLIDIVAS